MISNQLTDHQDQMKALENSLGIPFFAKLEAVVHARIELLDDSRAAFYLVGLLEGIQNKHPWLSHDWMVGFLDRVCGDRVDRIAKVTPIEKGNGIGVLVFDDLLEALGMDSPGDRPRSVSPQDLMLLGKVFQGKPGDF